MRTVAGRSGRSVLFVEDVELIARAVPVTPGLQQGAQGAGGPSLASDDLAEIVGGHAQLDHGVAPSGHDRQLGLVRLVDQQADQLGELALEVRHSGGPCRGAWRRWARAGPRGPPSSRSARRRASSARGSWWGRTSPPPRRRRRSAPGASPRPPPGRRGCCARPCGAYGSSACVKASRVARGPARPVLRRSRTGGAQARAPHEACDLTRKEGWGPNRPVCRALERDPGVSLTLYDPRDLGGGRSLSSQGRHLRGEPVETVEQLAVVRFLGG